MTPAEWIICSVILAALIGAAIYLVRGSSCKTCAHCPLRGECAAQKQQEVVKKGKKPPKAD